MIKNDLFSEKMKKLSEIIQEIMLSNRNKQYEISTGVLNRAYKELLGIDFSLVNKLSYEDIVAFIGAYETSQTMKFIILGELLSLDAQIKNKLGNDTEYINLCFKSLYAYLSSITNDSSSLEFCGGKIEDLLSILEDYELDHQYKLALVSFYQLTGKFDSAEDIIYDLLEESGNSPEVISCGINFYNSLINKSEEELIKGNLPINEVREGLKVLMSINEA